MAVDPYSDPWTEHQLKRWTRPDAHRFVRPDWRRFVKSGHEALLPFHRYERKYSPEQPRVPAGVPEGGQWTSEGGGGGSSPRGGGASPTAGSGRNDARVSSDVAPSNYHKPGTQLAQLRNEGAETGADNRPVYDTVDAAMLVPKGIGAAASQQKLEYRLDDSGHYLSGVTVVNEDHTIVGRMINAINGTPVHIGFDVRIQTADGEKVTSFEIRKNLPPGGSYTVPRKDIGLLRGPGRVAITVTNRGSLYTGVIVGAQRMRSGPNQR